MGNNTVKVTEDLVKNIESHLRLERVAGIPRIVTESEQTNDLLTGTSLAELRALEAEALGCKKCRLCEGRTKVVFGSGCEVSPLVAFVGEGPGAEEDRQGKPFVGRAGELLTGAITKGMGLDRETQTYICNIVKCRPPENRAPLPDESAACTPYLFKQLELIQPKVVVSLGASALRGLCGIEGGITKLRGTWMEWRGFKLMPTLHPAYLLRNPPAKKDFWADLQEVMRYLGLPVTEKIPEKM